MDYGSAPLKCLSPKTRATLSILDDRRLLHTPEGIARDWRGLAQLIGLEPNIYSRLQTSQEPTDRLLHVWQEKHEANLLLLCTYLQQIDRYDVLDDCSPLFEQDYQRYSNNENHNDSPADQIVNFKANNAEQSDALTTGDVQTSSLQIYDAFVLFANEDTDFAQTLLSKMRDHGFNLCVRDDLLCGLNTEHSAIVKLLTERCARLVVILSPAFITSPFNHFIIEYTQALAIELKQRKILPIIYKPCKVPIQLSYYFPLNYLRLEPNQFWSKLKDSLEITAPSQRLPEPEAKRSKNKHKSPKSIAANPSTSNIKLTEHKDNGKPLTDKIPSVDLNELPSMNDLPPIDELNLTDSISSNEQADVNNSPKKSKKKNKVKDKFRGILNYFAQ